MAVPTSLSPNLLDLRVPGNLSLQDYRGEEAADCRIRSSIKRAAHFKDGPFA